MRNWNQSISVISSSTLFDMPARGRDHGHLTSSVKPLAMHNREFVLRVEGGEKQRIHSYLSAPPAITFRLSTISPPQQEHVKTSGFNILSSNPHVPTTRFAPCTEYHFSVVLSLRYQSPIPYFPLTFCLYTDYYPLLDLVQNTGQCFGS